MAALGKLDGAANRELFLKVALQAQDRTRARLIAEMAVMYAAYNEKETPIDRFYPLLRILHAIDKKGRVLLVLPTDYILWSTRLAGALEELKKRTRGERFALWTTGEVSRRCREQLARAGWSTHARALAKLSPK